MIRVLLPPLLKSMLQLYIMDPKHGSLKGYIITLKQGLLDLISKAYEGKNNKDKELLCHANTSL